jgi:hypothetical protein
MVSDCPAGEKCIPVANDDGAIWNSTACVAIDPDAAAVGDLCTATPPGTLGDDDCEQGAVCWNVGSDGVGTCVAMCSIDLGVTYAAAEGHCAGAPGAHCVTGSGGVVDLCLPTCNPLPAAASGCAFGDGCYPIHHGFACAQAGGPPTSPVPQGLGDPCEHVNDCEPGLFCLDAAVQAACPADRCCAEYCDRAAADPCATPGTECIPWYEQGTDVPLLAELGACAAMALPLHADPGLVTPSAVVFRLETMLARIHDRLRPLLNRRR